MRISWITYNPIGRSPGGLMTSSTASIRYRVLMPIEQTQNGPFEHRVVTILPNAQPETKAAALDCDLMIFSKSFLESNEALGRQALGAGIPVIFDVCDDHYDHPQYGPHYRAMTALATQVTCNGEQMAAVASGYARSAPVVIEDPYEGPRGDPRFAPGERLRLLWFGHPGNLDSLEGAIAEIAAFAMRRPVELRVLTQLNGPIVEACRRLSERYAPRLEVSASSWSLEAQWSELAQCDAVILPSLQTRAKRVKSANRMLQALWAGRPAIAHPLPAYEPFGGWTPVTPSLSEGLERLVAEPDTVSSRVSRAQSFIETHYSPAKLGEHWRRVLEAYDKPPGGAG